MSHLITEEDVRKFADISGDHNPVHLDEEYAKQSRYGRRIAHGLFSASFFSGLFGTKLPGRGCVYAAQNLKFRRPVYIGDMVVATVTVVSVDVTKKRVLFSTVCSVNDKEVILGDAEIFIP
ncbi:(R)-specific enoyl-CoA hydratase [Verrucomicrobiota bacterium]|nr:(R)-specific enoyl-CoA hydratase [Verrucomicrobiota bacterium]